MANFMAQTLNTGKQPRHPLIKGCEGPRAGLVVSERREKKMLRWTIRVTLSNYIRIYRFRNQQFSKSVASEETEMLNKRPDTL
jgi:hypothetical protein